MNNIENTLKVAWQNIESYSTGSLQLGIDHPLEWHVAYETPINKALVIVSNYAIDSIESSKSIQTICRKREEGNYYISFQLLEKTQESVFISMCSNLIEYSSSALSEKDALKMVGIRYKQWRKLMEHQRETILSDEKRKGLIGELLYLNEIIENGKESKEALDGWVGPEGADQDFVYEEIWREIKTTGVASEQISINSLEQLGSNEKGILIISRVDSCAPEKKGAFTLRDLVSKTKAHFVEDVSLTELFFDKLGSVGFIDIEAYDKYFYCFSRSDKYEIDESFPRIKREDVRSEIINCKYTLSISSIEGWRRE